LTDVTNEGRQLRRLRWGTRIAPLVKPYALSFADIAAFNAVWVWAEDHQGRIGVGEAVALPGYNWETDQTIRAAVATICENGDASPVPAVVQKCRDFQQEHPFAASAVMAALDMPLFLAYADAQAQFPISAPVSGGWPVGKLRRAVEAQLRSGYDFIKVKVGRDLDSDIAAARCVSYRMAGQGLSCCVRRQPSAFRRCSAGICRRVALVRLRPAAMV
jgi:L-alanine-DL-glutamate epimerase-like enolase superfamily enzyme